MHYTSTTLDPRSRAFTLNACAPTPPQASTPVQPGRARLLPSREPANVRAPSPPQVDFSPLSSPGRGAGGEGPPPGVPERSQDQPHQYTTCQSACAPDRAPG